VEGLTRENVASHLQKYRLQSKRWDERPARGDHEGGAHGGEHSPPPPAKDQARRWACWRVVPPSLPVSHCMSMLTHTAVRCRYSGSFEEGEEDPAAGADAAGATA
jgi:hypothetical protein